MFQGLFQTQGDAAANQMDQNPSPYEGYVLVERDRQ